MKNLFIIFILFFCFISIQAQIVDIPDTNFKYALVNEIVADTNGDGLLDNDVDTNDDGEIQVSEAEAVTYLRVFNFNISSLEGIESFINIKRLFCAGNQLTSLLTQNPNLWLLHCYDNQLTSLDVSQTVNLWELNCSNNQLISLNVTQLLSLDWFDCSYNQLIELNIKNNHNNSMTAMVATNNPNLSCIQVYDVDFAYTQNCFYNHWCKDNWTIYSEDCNLGNIENNLNRFNIYPNPVQKRLYIDSQQLIENLTIYNIQGQLILNEISNNIDVSFLSTGLYFVQVTIDGKSETKKFVKE